jgi:hypothetical protein
MMAPMNSRSAQSPFWRACASLLPWLSCSAVVLAEAPPEPEGPPEVAAVSDFLPSNTPFGETFCLNVKFAQGQTLDDLPMLADLGVRWVRDSVLWPQIEPEPEHFAEFPPAFNKRLAYYRERGIGVVYVLGMDNPVAYPNTAQSPANSANPYRFARYATVVAKHLRAAGVSFVLEIWNEPHNSMLQKSLGGSWQGAAPAAWLDHYVKMVNSTVEAVHKVDRKIQLLTDDDMWIVHYWMLEKGLAKTLGGMAIHPYSPLPERTAVAHDTDWTRPFTVVDPDRSFGSAVRRLRAQGVSKLGHDPSMWVTEWGWLAGGTGAKSSAEDVARFLPRAFVLSAAAGVKATCWFSAQDVSDGPMGLTTNQREARPAFIAYRTMSKLLGPLVLESHVVGRTAPAAGIQAYRFSGGGVSRLIAWHIDGQQDIVLRGSPRASGWDHYGARLPDAGPRGLSVKLSASPVYLEGVSDTELRSVLKLPER